MPLPHTHMQNGNCVSVISPLFGERLDGVYVCEREGRVFGSYLLRSVGGTSNQEQKYSATFAVEQVAGSAT